MIQNKLSQELTIKDNLKSIAGFGPHSSDQFCYKLGINPRTKLSSLNSAKKEAFIKMLTELSQNTTEVSYKDK